MNRIRRSLAVAVAAVPLLLSGCALLGSDSYLVTGREGGTACTVALPTDASVPERVAALRALGLFADRSSLTDAELGAEVARAIEDQWGPIDPSDWMLDLLVAEQDRSRVWWQDLEADVGDGNEVYEQTIDGWSAISIGAFEPTGIEERWESWTGPVTVAFELDGVPQTLRPAYLEDWIDLAIIDPINDLIAPSGRRFVVFQAFDQTAYVMALTAEERAGLESRGWCFS